MQRYSLILILCTFLTCLLGCGGGGSDTVPISGIVTFNGEAVPKGSITLTPIDGKIAPDAGSIANGEFAFQAKPGPKRVEIGASRPGAPDPEMKSPNQVQYIPRRYNVESKLEIEISPDSDNHFTFDLSSDGAVKTP
jgi:hypothetical protein